MCFQCFPLSFSPRRAFVLGSCCLRQRESADLSRASPLLACSRHPWGRVQGRRWGGGASDVSCFHQNIQCRDNALVDRKGSCPLKEGFLFLKGRERFTYTHNTRLHTTECGQVDFLQWLQVRRLASQSAPWQTQPGISRLKKVQAKERSNQFASSRPLERITAPRRSRIALENQ